MSGLLERLQAALADRYSIAREIGAGGMATVFLARDLKHGRDVALKVMRPEMAAVLGQERFLSEIQTLAALTHPHILPLYDSGETEAGLFYVMPYVDGESLQDRLDRETRLPVGEAVAIAREVASGLAYAHTSGVVHRDIKPDNILLSGDHAIVADFGIARAVVEAGGDRLTATGLTVGTPAYMSPEQALGGSRVDGRSDVYSLACVLFEMLAGEIPFGGPDARTILSRKTGEKPRPLRTLRETVPPPVEEAVSMALSPEPADRFGTASEFADALERAATPAPIPVDVSVTDRQARPRRRWALWAGGIVVAVLVLGGLWAAFRLGENRPTASTGTVEATPGDGIAVLPFQVIGVDPELWREGLVHLLSTNLDGLGDLRKIDPRVVLSRWERRIGEDRDAPDIGTALSVAEAGGARYAVLGSLVDLEETARLTVDVYDVQSGERRGTAEAVGSPDSLQFLASQVTLEILDLVGGPGIRVTDLSRARLTRSGVALRQYLLGERESRRFRWPEALGHYDAAAEADTSFVLALYKAALACDWTFCAAENPYVERALGLSDRLPQRDALLLRGLAQRIDNQQTAISTLDTLVALYPDEVVGWYELGEASFHLGPQALIPPDEFRAAFRHTVELDSGFITAYAHLFSDALFRQDSADLIRLMQRHRAVDSTAITLAAAEVSAALAWGDSSDRSDALARLETASDRILTAVGVQVLSSPHLGETSAEVFRMQAGRGTPPQGWRQEHVLVHAHAGRPDSAWAAASSSLAGAEARKTEAAIRLYLHVSGLPASHDIWRVVEVLAAAGEPDIRFLVGALAVQEQRWDIVQREIERLAADSAGLDTGQFAARAATFQRALQGYAQGRRGDAESALRAIEGELSRLSGLGEVAFAGYYAHAVLRQEVGRLLLAGRRPAEARRYFESGTYPIFHIDVARAEACLGEVHERLGNPELAAHHYQRFVRWWEGGQPVYRAMAELGRQAVERVSGPGADEDEYAPEEGLCARLLAQ